MVVKEKEVESKVSVIPGAISSVMSKVHDMETAKTDISLLKLMNYNLILFVPVLLFMVFALKIGEIYSGFFDASPIIVAKILMVPFMLLLFFFIVPFIREREKIAGIRYSIVAFCVIGIGLTLPSALRGDWGFMMTILNYFGSYILVTFMMCPEVLGIERNLRDWFKHKKQVLIIVIFLSIVLFSVIGFGSLYYDIYKDAPNGTAFSLQFNKEPGMGTFIYYSMVSFSTTGYGDILPVSTAARFVFFMESLFGIIINVLFLAILLVFVSNAEFLSQKSEENVLTKEIKEEKEIKQEVEEIRKVEKEVIRKKARR